MIEFAVCMPILIILLFYINDLVRIKRYYSQTEFVAQQMANILQNISQKRITINDMRYTASLAWLSLYPGITMYADQKRENYSHELSHMPAFYIYYVRGLSGGKASVIWGWNFYCNRSTTPATWLGGVMTSGSNRSAVTWGTNVESSIIYPTLKINEGEEKIVIECYIENSHEVMSVNEYNASDDQDIRAKKAFKLRFVTPKFVYKDSLRGHYFDSVVIFTPKPGLFSETALTY